MLLKEMFSAIGAPSKEENQEIDYLSDLKFFIDNDNEMLSNHFFPAIHKHHKWHGHPDAYKLYINPLEKCAEAYCSKFDLDNKEEIFPRESLIELAKICAEEQHQHIENGHYK
jgi:hypothetical protein